MKYSRFLKQLTITLLIASSPLISHSQQLKFMGIPINSTIEDFCQVLTAHNFKDMYPGSARLAHMCWEGGNFWRQNNTSISLFSYDKKHIELIEIKIPFSNFKNADDYVSNVQQLQKDLWNKYGTPKIDTINMEKINKEGDVFFYDWDHGNDVFIGYTWNYPNGTLKVSYNAQRIWTIKLQYIAIERENRHKRSLLYKEKGADDL